MADRYALPANRIYWTHVRASAARKTGGSKTNGQGTRNAGTPGVPPLELRMTTTPGRRAGLRNEVEVISFHKGVRQEVPALDRHRPPTDAVIAVGGLVYGLESGRWVYRGVKETCLRSKLEKGHTGIGQVLAINEADARVIQRNLHESLGTRTYRISGTCTGIVARMLRQYLKNIGSFGLRPHHPLDFGRQLSTRGWVMQRNVYTSAPPARGSRSLEAERPAWMPSLPAIQRTVRTGRPARGSRRGRAPARFENAPPPSTLFVAPGPAVPIVVTSTATPAMVVGPVAPAAEPGPMAPPATGRATPGAVRGAIVRPLRSAAAKGRTALGSAVRAGHDRMAAFKAKTAAAKAARVATRDAPPRSSEVLPAESSRTEPPRPAARTTVRMRLGPPSRPPTPGPDRAAHEKERASRRKPEGEP